MDAKVGYGSGSRGLLVDWGGVLTGSLDGAMASWAERDAVEYEHFREVLKTWLGAPADGSPVHLLERGEMAVPEFEQVLAKELGRRGSPVAADGLLRRMLDGLDLLDADMVGVVRRARSLGVRTALLSNSWGDHYPEALWDGLFDEIVISGRVGMRKPEPEIFRYACDRLGLAPQQCVMVDDLPHNVHGAVAVGMVGVWHCSYAETLNELEAIFELSLR